MKKELFVTNIAKGDKALFSVTESNSVSAKEVYKINVEVDGRKWNKAKYREQYLQSLELTINVKGVKGIRDYVINGEVVPMAFM
jgi:hypothetical protein